MEDVTKRMLNNIDRILDIVTQLSNKIKLLEDRLEKLENANH